jgi:predicted nucleic acid-binding protein
MAWCFSDEAESYPDSVLEKLVSVSAFVPSIWPLEVGNVLCAAERRKRLSYADSIRFLELLNELPIIVEPESPERMLKEVFLLAREYNLSTYDASYLDLAMRKGLPIASLDHALKEAAGRCDVPVLKAK